MDLWTPYVNEYIKIFNRGMIPKNFKQHEKYETSLYLTSSECNINFYNKLSDLKSKYDFQEVQKEYIQLGQIPTGVMRLEIQRKNKKILRLKEKYNLPDTTVKSLWNADIARDLLQHYIISVIGKGHIIHLQDSLSFLENYCKMRTVSLCRELMQLIIKFSKYNLSEIKRGLKTDYMRNNFKRLKHTIEKLGINIITLEAIEVDTERINYLQNPWTAINFL